MSKLVKKIARSLRPLELAGRWVRHPLRDAAVNRRLCTAPERIAVVRHRVHITSYYDPLLHWIEQELPQMRAHLELHTLPARSIDFSRTHLVIPWVSENEVNRSPATYRHFKQLEERASQYDVAVINPVDAILRGRKYEASQLIAAAGIRTPRMQRITNAARFRRDTGGMPLPLLIRENNSHGGRTPSFLVRKESELAKVPIERFEDPVASEFIDVQNPADGYFRKYRYLAAGQRGIAASLHIACHWEVRGRERDVNAITQREEMSFQRQEDPNHARFQQVRRKLGLDAVAFDYSYTPSGELVVWEINVLPGMGLMTSPERKYINYGMHRCMAALAELYMLKANLQVPAEVEQILATGEVPSAAAKRAA